MRALLGLWGVFFVVLLTLLPETVLARRYFKVVKASEDASLIESLSRLHSLSHIRAGLKSPTSKGAHDHPTPFSSLVPSAVTSAAAAPLPIASSASAVALAHAAVHLASSAHPPPHAGAGAAAGPPVDNPRVHLTPELIDLVKGELSRYFPVEIEHEAAGELTAAHREYLKKVQGEATSASDLRKLYNTMVDKIPERIKEARDKWALVGFISKTGVTPIQTEAMLAFLACSLRHFPRIIIRLIQDEFGEGCVKWFAGRARARDIKVYGNPDGPTFDWLMRKRFDKFRCEHAHEVIHEEDYEKMYRAIVVSATTTNKIVNAATGGAAKKGAAAAAADALVLAAGYSTCLGFLRAEGCAPEHHPNLVTLNVPCAKDCSSLCCTKKYHASVAVGAHSSVQVKSGLTPRRSQKKKPASFADDEKKAWSDLHDTSSTPIAASAASAGAGAGGHGHSPLPALSLGLVGLGGPLPGGVNEDSPELRIPSSPRCRGRARSNLIGLEHDMDAVVPVFPCGVLRRHHSGLTTTGAGLAAASGLVASSAAAASAASAGPPSSSPPTGSK